MRKIISLCALMMAIPLTGCSNDVFILGMGNSDVPVGQYTSKILKFYNLNEKELADKGYISYGENVKVVTTQIKHGLVSCGVIYQTDAKSANLKVVDTATEEMCGKVIYPAAILKSSSKKEAAISFLSYLRGSLAMSIFESVGFSRLAEQIEEVSQVTSQTELVIYAAASLTETLTTIKTNYEAIHNNITLTYNFASSGTLKTLIQNGENCDIFLSASPKQMNQLDIMCDESVNPDRLDFIDHQTRIDLLENKVALAVPDNNPQNVTSFLDLKNRLEKAVNF